MVEKLKAKRTQQDRNDSPARLCYICKEIGVGVEELVEGGRYYCLNCRTRYNVGTP